MCMCSFEESPVMLEFINSMMMICVVMVFYHLTSFLNGVEPREARRKGEKMCSNNNTKRSENLHPSHSYILVLYQHSQE